MSNIAFIGTGVMGAPMAGHLVTAGHTVTVYNRSRAKAEAWAEKYGGRHLMIGILLFCALPTFLLSQVTNYGGLLACAVLFGLAGNSFSVGVVWISSWR